ncbi:MAG: ComF family protein [Saprospiraceae bacterium]|nr:ComF family protein [Saprospiraceae bacterium]
MSAVRKIVKRTIADVLHLLYPQLCIACHTHAVDGETLICLACESKLEVTNFHEQYPNECSDRLQSIQCLAFAASMFRFYPAGQVQEMIHQIKYGAQTHAAYQLGLRFGTMLKSQDRLKDLDLIVPIPLHIRKLRRRGFNQSDFLAQGLSEALHIPWSKNTIKRVRYTESQTAKNRMDRLKNMENAFTLVPNQDLHHKHIMLVDDVLTTGATVEACAITLNQKDNLRISVVTLAIAAS